MNFDIFMKQKMESVVNVKLLVIIVLFENVKKHTLHQQQINFRCQPAVLVSRAAFAREHTDDKPEELVRLVKEPPLVSCPLW